MTLRNYLEDIMDDYASVTINGTTVSNPCNAESICLSKSVGTLIVIEARGAIIGRLRRTSKGVEML